MKSLKRSPRCQLGRVSTDTKGPPGIFMERTGFNDHPGLAQ